MKILKKTTNLILILLFILSFSLNAQDRIKKNQYDARTAEWEILTPPTSESPRINGPQIYGAKAGKQFIYRIPCEGLRPIHFVVSNLPEGLKLDKEKGIISGITPNKEGNYNMIFEAINEKGSASREFKLVIGEKIALTPPMGWNSWGGYMLQVSDDVMRRATDFIVNKGLADVGFQYISIDDCWMRIDPKLYNGKEQMYSRRAPGYPFENVVGSVRDECGMIQPNDCFPDMKAMTDYIHSFGLKAGIYSGPGPLTCQMYASSFGYEGSDANQFADWGFDLLKYDMCSYRGIISELNKALPEGSPEIEEITIWYPMAQYLEIQDRDILYNLCQYGRQEPWLWAPTINIQSWRIGGDLNHNVNNYFEQAMRIVKYLRDYSKPGQWNDPDFMYIGKIHEARDKMGPPVDIPLNSNQRYQYVSLWSLICAPYFFSANIDEMDDFTISLLRNADISNVNQDELGHVAELIRENDNQVVLLKKLADGSNVIGLFNNDSENEQIINVKWDEIGLSGKLLVRDLWRQKEIGTTQDELSVKVSPNGCAVLKIY